jgi:hypothetical protein
MTDGQWLWLLGMAAAETVATARSAGDGRDGEAKRYRSTRRAKPTAQASPK